MIALCVDDEALSLNALESAVGKSTDISDIAAFDDERDALDWARKNPFDIAFLDIRMHEMGGIALAEKLREIKPRLPVVFCTRCREYAFDALQLHASGYILKPVSADAVQREIDYIKGISRPEYLIKAQCFGSFEVYARGVPLRFKRAKTKELLAYLIDRKGASVSAREICAQLWEDRSDKSYGMNYLHQLTSDLRSSLRAVGAEPVFLSKAQGYSVDTSRIDCDYYHYLEGDKNAERSFTGEYMSNYSWSEYTCAYLLSKNG